MHKIYALVEINSFSNYASKATSVQSWTGTDVSRSLRIPDFMKLDTWMW